MTPESKTPSILKISIFNSIIETLQLAISFFFGVYFAQIGFSGAQIGIIFAINIVTSILTTLPSGFSNDAFKSKNLIGIALVFTAFSYFGLSISHNFITIILLFFTGGIGATLYKNSIESLFYKNTDKKQIPEKIALYQGLKHILLGIGMICSGYLLKIGFSFENLFFIFSIIFLTMALLSQLILPSSSTAKLKLLKYKKDILRPKVLYFILILFLFALHFGAEKTTYGLFLNKYLLLNKFEMGLYMGTAVIFMAFTVFFLSKKIKKIQPQNILLFALLVSGLGHILMTINNPKISLIFRIIHEIGDASFFFFLFYGITKLFDLKRIGGNAGIFTFTSVIGSAVGALIFGPIGDQFGYNIPMIISGIITLIAFILTLKFINHFIYKEA